MDYPKDLKFFKENQYNIRTRVNNTIEIRKEGLKALREALGFAEMVKFIHQYENGEGDYTKEKYEYPDVSLGQR